MVIWSDSDHKYRQWLPGTPLPGVIRFSVKPQLSIYPCKAHYDACFISEISYCPFFTRSLYCSHPCFGGGLNKFFPGPTHISIFPGYPTIMSHLREGKSYFFSLWTLIRPVMSTDNKDHHRREEFYLDPLLKLHPSYWCWYPTIQDYSSINSCAEASPVLSNFTMVSPSASTSTTKSSPPHWYQQIMFNPSAFIEVIKCACTDTFQSAFPQCVDWYVFSPMQSFLDGETLESSPLVLSRPDKTMSSIRTTYQAS